MTELGRRFLRALSERERRIVVMVCAGHANRKIAERIGTSEQCVKNAMRLVLQKSGKRNRFELIVFCFGSGCVQCPCTHRPASLQQQSGAAYADVSVTASAPLL